LPKSRSAIALNRASQSSQNTLFCIANIRPFPPDSPLHSAYIAKMIANEGDTMTEPTLALGGEFPAPSRDQWLGLVDKALKGAPFDKKLVTRLYEGIAVQPIYTKAEGGEPSDVSGLPGQMPFTRGAVAGRDQGWEVCTEQQAAEAKVVNAAILEDLYRGATSVLIRFDAAARAGLDGDAAAAADLAGRDGTMIYSIDDLDLAFKDVFLDLVPISLEAGTQTATAAAMLAGIWRARGIQPAQARGFFNADPLGTLAADGHLPATLNSSLRQAAELACWTAEHWPAAVAMGVDTSAYSDAGATESQDLAAAISTGLAYLRALTAAGLGIDTACRQIRFTFSVGCDQFLSIAKLRAARRLWARITEACGATEPARAMRIHARTARRMMSQRDPWVNMLRTTVAGFAAGLGGADSVAVLPFDHVLGPSDDFARRIARNTQILLLEESSLSKVIDPAGGSWYVEHLTTELAEVAWAAFQEIERRGGMAAVLLDGSFAAEIAEAWSKREADIARRRVPLTGINEFPNILEQPVERPAPDFAALRQAAAERLAPARRELPPLPGLSSQDDRVEAAEQGYSIAALASSLADGEGVSIPPLPRHRLPESFEALRDAADRYKDRTGSWPVLFLANLGKVAQHTGRATYAKNFFEAGGIQTLPNSGFASAETCAEAFKASGARISVLCGADLQYESMAEPFAKALKAAGADYLFLAGNPGEHKEAYQAAGIDAFISVGADVLSVLRATLGRLGVDL